MKNSISGFTGLLKNLYFFVDLVGKVQVIYRWKVSWAISGNGQRSGWLIGDHHMTKGENVTPLLLLWRAKGSQAN